MPAQYSTQFRIIAILFVLALFTTHIAAQALPKLPGNNNNNDNNDNAAAATTTTDDSKDANTATTDTATASPATTNSASTPATTTTSSKPSPTTSDALGLTGLPKLAGDNYPPPSVPPTADAPFMQKSTLPEGTVFIGVGAALGFIGAVVIAWRVLAAWLLHRSVKRTAMAQARLYGPLANPGGGKSPMSYNDTEPKRRRKSRADPLYSDAVPMSMMASDHVSSANKAAADITRASARNTLFFSPTAGAGAGAGQGTYNSQNRVSSYLPAGYYAAGNAALGGGATTTHIGGVSDVSTNPVGRTTGTSNRTSRAPSRGQSPTRSTHRNSMHPSADSPIYASSGRNLSTTGLVSEPRTNSMNLNVAPQAWTPSAYLEDLFESGAISAPGDMASVHNSPVISPQKDNRSRRTSEDARRKRRSRSRHA